MEKLVRQALNKYRRKTGGRWSKDWILKVFSLFFAIIMWYIVVGEDTVDQTVVVPIEITNLPRNLIISNQFKKQLEVTVSGPRGLVRSVSDRHITRSVDLADARPGNKVIQNKADSVNFPSGITVQRIQPSNVTLIIDRLLEKELPIKPVIKGKPATGFEVVSINPDPTTLSLTAPASALSDEIFLSTQSIDVSNSKSGFNKQVQLDVKPAIAELIGEPVISVTVVIKEKRVKREFHDIPVELNHNGQRTIYHLDTHLVSIKTDIPFIY